MIHLLLARLQSREGVFVVMTKSLLCMTKNNFCPPLCAALPSQASAIASLIMEAMSDECCLYFAGTHGLERFHAMMTTLVARQHTQYSYENTLVALHDNEVAGVCVAYNGALLHSLRRAFVEAAREWLEGDFGQMTDETGPGELYVDSLAVAEKYRHRGIATALLDAMDHRARREQLPAVGLLVDEGNHKARRFYSAIGFREVGVNTWGGHPMLHLQRKV